MGDVLPFKRPKASEKHRGKSLCKNGFHKWLIKQEKGFDVREGKLITVYICERCGKTKTKAH